MLLNTKYPLSKSIKAFTLVELSIVIVVIALIVTVVTAGSTMVKLAKINNMLSQIAQFKAAAIGFKLQYNAKPGDLSTASSYWPTCDGTPANCNGNSNNKIELGTGGSTSEVFRAWQHLALAGLIPGIYSGTATGTVGVLGVNVPKGPFQNSGYIFKDHTNPLAYNSKYLLTIGKAQADVPDDSLFTPIEAQRIDNKIDDGLPELGKVLSWEGANHTGNCHDSATVYTVSNTNIVCYMFFSVE